MISSYAADYDEISTVNNFYQSLFSSVSCVLNGVEITDPSGNWYSYKAYLETILSFSKSTKDGRLTSQCYFNDIKETFDSIGTVDNNKKTTVISGNAGYIKRKAFFHRSKTRYFNIPLHSDICTLRKYLPPNSKLEFEFIRSPDAFSLLTPYDGDDCKIIIEDLSLSLTRYTPSTPIYKFHTENLSKQKKQVLPIDRSLIKTYT